MKRLASLIAMSALTVSIHAQTRVFPQCVFWQPQPPGVTTDPSGKFVQMIWAQSGPVAYSDLPLNCAVAFVEELEVALADGRVTEDTVYVLIKDIGHDNACVNCCATPSLCPPNACDDAHLDCNGNPVPELASVTAWYRTEDRDVTGIYIDTEFPQDEAPDRSDRGYRHPFIKNATRPPANQPQPGMRQWMISFVNKVEELRQNGAEIGDPTKWHYRFDTEPYNISGPTPPTCSACSSRTPTSGTTGRCRDRRAGSRPRRFRCPSTRRATA